MPKRIMLFVFASLLAVIPMTTRSGHAAPAPENCVTAPHGAPLEGSHWYYHVDGENHRKCWYLGPQGAKVRHIASTKPDRIAKSIPAPPPEPSALQPMAPIQAAAGANSSDSAAASRWPDPPTMVAGPDSEPTVIAGSGTDARPASEAIGSETTAMPLPQPAAARLATVEQPLAFAVDWKLMLGLLAGALALAAIIGRAIFRQPAVPCRRRPDFLDRPDAAWTAPHVSERIPPAFAGAGLRRFREVSIAPEVEAAPIPRHAEINRAASGPGDASDEIEDLLRRLEQAWERTAA